MDPLCLLGQALECSVCLEQLDNTSRVLPCQHTFCKKCLLDIVNTHKELRCPECRVLVTVPFDQLPPNILLMRILEGMKKIPHSTEESSTNGFCDKFASFDAFKASSQMASTDSTTSVLTSMGANVQSSSIATILSSSELIRTRHTSQSASFPSQPPPASTSQSFPSTMLQPFQSSLSYSIPTTLIQAMSSSTPNIRASSQLLTPANTVQDNFSSSGVSSISLYSLTRPCSSSDSLMQTNPRTEISLITNSVNTQNIQVVSSPVATPPIPSVISPLVSAGTHSNSCIQTGTTQSGVLNNFSASSSSSIPPFQANFNLLPSTSSATQAPSGLSSHMLQFDSSLRVSHSSLPSSDSGVELKSLPTSLSNNLQNLNYASNPSLENSVQSGPSSEMASGSYSNAGIVQNLESHAPSTIRSVSSEETPNLSNSRAEEQFRICSSLIEKGTPMAFPSNTYAKAIFTYVKREPRDLSFNKGDLIQVLKKIDENWYQGELHGNLGFFPASYVRIFEKPPLNVPQCKALYDFKMTSQEEKDCLTFNKGDIITVLRRIDENWAEGKYQNLIGIFPLSFVELNGAAKMLMGISNDTDTTFESRCSPASCPPHTVSRPISTSASLSSRETNRTSSVSRPRPPQNPSLNPRLTLSPTVLSPITSNSVPQASIALQNGSFNQAGKRHSFIDHQMSSVAGSSVPLSGSNRFSLEITNKNVTSSFSGTPSVSSVPNQSISNISAIDSNLAMKTKTLQVSETKKNIAKGTINSPTLQYFIALYAYRPRKADELELKKGQIYSVFEKCQDGWYKGRCITTDKIGVFPGNYVSFATLQTLATYRAKLTGTLPTSMHLNSISGKTPISSSSTSIGPPHTRSSVIANQNSSFTFSDSGSNCKHSNTLFTSPPDLPPRHVSSSSPGVLSSPLPSNSSERSKISSFSNSDKKMAKEKTLCNGAGGAAGMGLMKKLASGKKKCKSPPLLSLDNPVFDESSPKLSLKKLSDVSNNVSDRATSGDSSSSDSGSLKRNKQPLPLARERFRCIVAYPANTNYELELQVGDIIYVHKKRDDGWYKGTLQRTGQTGLFPASFVESC